MSDRKRADPLVQVGDLIEIPEADYCYGLGVLKMRVTAMTITPQEVSRLEWVRLIGVPIYMHGQEGPEREALISVAALRQHPPKR
ncbi:hypothetical protein [Actinoplanes sp. TFC3]|uniref:hypothetical protein n=1 Tax=Actinoplanes sp. TFC3 TaxID=1710355 RepID=UPI0008311029|nr:hypothetical protein [Actinoplanes sp. TFC3]